MSRTRKQLAEHAGELARKMLAVLERERLVPRFVDSYVAEFDRRGLKAHSSGYRELLATLGREVLLAMVAQVNTALARYLSRRRPPVLRGPEVQAADAFSQEFLASLARTLHWTAADVEEFRHDLNLYAQLGARQPIPKRRRRPTDPVEGPFVDRCALLLDPSMLDKARHAAGKFLLEIERVTEKILASAFRRWRRG
jgi:hypothetical protein